jgi:hypothetical protein
MNYPYFGFQMPGVDQQLMQQNPFANPATQYQGAMPAGLGGMGASPMSNIQQGVTPNMANLMPMGLMGVQMMQQARQQPGQQQQQQPQFGGLLGPIMTQAMMHGDQIGQQGTGQQETGITGLVPWLRDALMNIGK